MGEETRQQRGNKRGWERGDERRKQWREKQNKGEGNTSVWEEIREEWRGRKDTRGENSGGEKETTG